MKDFCTPRLIKVIAIAPEKLVRIIMGEFTKAPLTAVIFTLRDVVLNKFHLSIFWSTTESHGN